MSLDILVFHTFPLSQKVKQNFINNPTANMAKELIPVHNSSPISLNHQYYLPVLTLFFRVGSLKECCVSCCPEANRQCQCCSTECRLWLWFHTSERLCNDHCNNMAHLIDYHYYWCHYWPHDEKITQQRAWKATRVIRPITHVPKLTISIIPIIDDFHTMKSGC